MKKTTTNFSYTAPECRVGEICYEQNFLATGDFGDEGNAGKNLGAGDEFDF